MPLIRSARFPEAAIAPEDFKDDTPFEPRPVPAQKGSAQDLIQGLEIVPLVRNQDARGALVELSVFAQETEPVVHVYQVFAEPGSVRAWVYHKRQYDRLAYTNGDFEVVLFDIRQDSPTHRMLNVLHVGEKHPCLIRVPPLVVHGVKNRGAALASFVNMPTRRYNAAHPDKSRLPKNDPRIPYTFDER
ncbi:MAG: polysaccharide biosynthesis protein [Xanthobacteraceae bacterium]|nr:polysaccharide biosynthesis protein [Xanthobacteraceae bacterium]